ncbi:MAG: DUF309 domain-containing protein [Acidobacteria bacterium]|nr:DUF309 domain-containing protein [Acidobacteriota bacterium]
METWPEEFLRGVKLFNDGKFFECHEAWETVWLKSAGVEREFLHAMVQAAAALHHVQRGNCKGAQSVGRRAIGKLAAVPETVMRINTINFRLSLEAFLSQTEISFPQIELQAENQ